MENYIKVHEESKQVSLTGARALALMAGLYEGPKSFEEIKQFMRDCGLTTKDYSIDTIRIDINTLKKSGFEISKATKRNNHKYTLISHPFVFKPTEEEINAVKTVYKKVARKATPEVLYLYHKFFQHIADKMQDGELKEQVLGISSLKSVDIDLLKELVQNEKKHNKIRIAYKAPGKEEEEIDITVEKVAVRNGKLYVYCYNHNLGEKSFLNVTRIRSIICNMFDSSTPLGEDVVVKFKLTNPKEYELDDNEIIDEEHPDYIIVTGKYFNDFIAVQRMLNFSRDCTVLEPDEFKRKIFEKLKGMRSVYGK